MTRSILPLALVAGLAVGCGASAPSPSTPATAQSAHAGWTESALRRLDPALRAEVRRGGEARRIAIKVYFRASPSDAELSELLLSRVGNQVVGNVQLATLQEIATRDDVDHIESLTDVGY
ncbi:MAG: hypothetical protein KC619_31115 [Myxococcales bacterium]|nr:hypothetical protein [Myxococcales bacterium]